jgi:hypothetical protein
MKLLRFPKPTLQPSEEGIVLTPQLQELAADVQRGQVQQVAVTVIRQNGLVERLGSVPEITRIR